MKKITILYVLIALMLSAACSDSYHDEDEFEELEEFEERQR
jgi:hypothetical protein